MNVDQPWSAPSLPGVGRVTARDALLAELQSSGTRALALVERFEDVGYLEVKLPDPDATGLRKLVTGVRGRYWRWQLTLRVQPEGEPEFVVEREFLCTLNSTWIGAYLPMIFDPRDHARIEIDESLEGRQSAAKANDGRLPADLGASRVQQEWMLAHEQEIAARSQALADRAWRDAADPATRLRALQRQHEAGMLSDEQYEHERKRILDAI